MAGTEDAESGQAPALRTKGKARAAGNLDKISPGDPDHGKAGSAPAGRGQGLRAEEDKTFRASADDKGSGIVRVFDTHPDNKNEDIVLFSGSRKQAERLHQALGKFLKK